MKKYLASILFFLLIFSIVYSQNISEKDVLEALLQSEKDIEEMSESGFSTIYVNDVLTDAKKAFEGVDYRSLLEEIELVNNTVERQKARQLIIEAQKTLGTEPNYSLVLEKTQIIAERKRQAYEISDSIRALELRITEFKRDGLETTGPEDLLDNAKIAFDDERYEDTEELISQADEELDYIQAETELTKILTKASKENIIAFVKDSWRMILIIACIFGISGYIAYQKYQLIRDKRRIANLKIEKETLLQLMKKTQEDHFKKGRVSKETYDIKMKKYKENMLKINRIIPVLESRTENKLKKNTNKQ